MKVRFDLFSCIGSGKSERQQKEGNSIALLYEGKEASKPGCLRVVGVHTETMGGIQVSRFQVSGAWDAPSQLSRGVVEVMFYREKEAEGDG